MSNKKALLLLAGGAEEMEACIAADILRRANIEVQIAGVDGLAAVTCSRNVRLLLDVALEAVRDAFDVVVLPGGAAGAERLAESSRVGECLRRQEQHGWIAAVCAAPIALLSHQVALGRRITSHPSVRERLQGSYELSDEAVVVDQNLITSQGPGTSFEFALCIVAELSGQAAADDLRAPLRLMH